MAENSKIEWTDHTVNLWWGCTKVHAGCDNCYAEHLAVNRFNNDIWGNDKPRRAIKSAFRDLAKYQRQAAKSGLIARVFVGSMMDIFEKAMKLEQPFDGIETTFGLRERFFQNITEGKYPNLEFLLLTKRPSLITKSIPLEWHTNPPRNLIIGTSVSDQETAYNLVPKIISHVPQGIRVFLSIEPQISEVNLSHIWLREIDWVIVGGESGNKKRPYNTDWARSIAIDCMGENVPFFFKQIDKVQPVPHDLLIRQFPKR